MIAPISAAPVRLSIIVPIFDARSTLSPCIAALVRAVGPLDEIIVVDDGSRDGGAAVLDASLLHRVRSVRSAVNIGRGPIRNLGAEHATGEVLLFIDADVVIHDRAVEQVRQAFATDPTRVAVIGSYDDQPAARNLVSQYRNLLHHHTHHCHGAQATHFWTGIGAVRRDVYEQLGGLDEARWARDMEDVEFGHRLVDAGHRIDVLPEIQGTHLKRYTLTSMLESDLMHRAIPWSRLMLHGRLRTDPFVTSWPQRISAASAATVLATTLLALIGLRRMAAPSILAAGGFVLINLPLWRFLTRTRSTWFAAACVPLHLVHATSTVAGFAIAATTPGASGLTTSPTEGGSDRSTTQRRRTSVPPPTAPTHLPPTSAAPQ